MSKQLTLSAAICVSAMAAMALLMSFQAPVSDSTARGATAHGSMISVLLRG